MTAAGARDVGPVIHSTNVGAIRRAFADTPAQLRTISLALTVALVVLGSLAAWTIRDRADATARVRDESGPLLVSTQELTSSLAESDAAATSAFLSGQLEDRDQRRSYDDTIARIAVLLEQSARTGGADETTHDLIADVQARTVVYAATIERARALRELGEPAALETLQSASAFRTERLVPTVDALAERARDRLDEDIGRATGGSELASAAVVAMLASVIAASVWMARRFRRIVNLPLVAATLLVLAISVWTLTATARQQSDLDSARSVGLPAVVALADARGAAYRLQTVVTTGLTADGTVSDDVGALRAAVSERSVTDGDILRARAGERVGFGGVLVSLVERPRDAVGRALAAETLERWRRYDTALESLRTTSDPQAAIALLSSDGNEAFTGFNVTIDALLAADRDVFLNDVARGADRFDHLALATLLASVVAAMAVLAGFAQRAREYR